MIHFVHKKNIILLSFFSEMTKQIDETKAKIMADKYQTTTTFISCYYFYYSILYYSMCFNKTPNKEEKKLRIFRYVIQMHLMFIWPVECLCQRQKEIRFQVKFLMTIANNYGKLTVCRCQCECHTLNRAKETEKE